MFIHITIFLILDTYYQISTTVMKYILFNMVEHLVRRLGKCNQKDREQKQTDVIDRT